MKTKSLFLMATLGSLLLATPSFAQDGQLLAYESSQKDSLTTVDDDINAALAALSEVNAILEPEKQETKETGSKADIIDVESILAAANTAEPAKEAVKPEVAAAKPAVTPEPAKVAAKPEAVAAKPEAVAAKPAVTPEPAMEAAKPVVVPESAQHPVVAANKAPNVQTAPTKAEKAEAAKVEQVPAKPVVTPEPAQQPIVAVNKAPNVQTAPTKAEKAEAVKTEQVAAKPVTTPAPAKPAQPVFAANTVKSTESVKIAPDGTHLTNHNPTTTPTPNPANAPHTLAMSYVMAIYKLNGIDLSKVKKPMPTIGELYQHAFTQKLVYHSTKPAIGDLAFFHNTLDRNRDGRWNDWHTLVGIVESIDQDETITVLTYQKDGIERIKLNLKYPELQTGKKGQILNTQIRPNEGAQKGTSAKLFAGFANLLGNATSVTVIDNWTPGMSLTK